MFIKMHRKHNRLYIYVNVHVFPVHSSCYDVNDGSRVGDRVEPVFYFKSEEFRNGVWNVTPPPPDSAFSSFRFWLSPI